MGKRYYCDYCDRSFKDDTGARKKHLVSLQHAKNRADHYSLFKEPEIILREEAAKTPCKRHATYGDCAFGQSCKFSHYATSVIRQLQQISAQRSHRRSRPASAANRPNPNEITQEFFRDPALTDDTNKIDYPVWSTIPELQNYIDIPPSLWPVTSETVTDSNFGKWGF